MSLPIGHRLPDEEPHDLVMSSAADLSIERVKREWDSLAEVRDRQVRTGVDLSTIHVLVPAILGHCRGLQATDVIDVGCGSGYLTERLARRFPRAVGIDPSGCSVRIARSHRSSAVFHAASAEEFAGENAGRFDCAVANMVLQTVAEVVPFLVAVRKMLREDGSLVTTIPHPAFWPRYWGYENEPWFEYSKEIAVESRFRISRELTNLYSTHIHRSLERYFDAFARSGFAVAELDELSPSNRVAKSYPTAWHYPRFMLLRLR